MSCSCLKQPLLKCWHKSDLVSETLDHHSNMLIQAVQSHFVNSLKKDHATTSLQVCKCLSDHGDECYWNSRANQQFSMGPTSKQLTGQNNGGTSSQAFLLARKGN